MLSPKLRIGSCFAGIGGMELGLEMTGSFETVWQIERDPYCIRVLEKHWPHVQRFGDIRTVDTSQLPPVDIIVGGWPCQPVSVAGRRGGDTDDRWLWPEFARLIREIRPRWVLAENVPGLRSIDNGRLFGTVLADLAACGYVCEWDGFPASAAGAHHIRDRVWIVAYLDGLGSGERTRVSVVKRTGLSDVDGCVGRCSGASGKAVAHPDGSVSPERGKRPTLPFIDIGRRDDRGGSRDDPRQVAVGVSGEDPCVLAHDAGPRCDARIFGAGWALRIETRRTQPERRGGPVEWCSGWLPEPDVVRVVHGLPTELDRHRLRALGNAVVPQVVAQIGRRIAAHAAGRVTSAADEGER